MADTIAPTISNCPNSQSYTVPIGTSVQTVTWTEPTAQDNTGVLPTLISTHQPGDEFPIGDTDVIYTATDQAGNSATCTFTITIGNSLPFFKLICHIYKGVFHLVSIP